MILWADYDSRRASVVDGRSRVDTLDRNRYTRAAERCWFTVSSFDLNPHMNNEWIYNANKMSSVSYDHLTNGSQQKAIVRLHRYQSVTPMCGTCSGLDSEHGPGGESAKKRHRGGDI